MIAFHGPRVYLHHSGAQMLGQLMGMACNRMHNQTTGRKFLVVCVEMGQQLTAVLASTTLQQVVHTLYKFITLFHCSIFTV